MIVTTGQGRISHAITIVKMRHKAAHHSCREADATEGLGIEEARRSVSLSVSVSVSVDLRRCVIPQIGVAFVSHLY